MSVDITFNDTYEYPVTTIKDDDKKIGSYTAASFETHVATVFLYHCLKHPSLLAFVVLKRQMERDENLWLIFTSDRLYPMGIKVYGKLRDFLKQLRQARKAKSTELDPWMAKLQTKYVDNKTLLRVGVQIPSASLNWRPVELWTYIAHASPGLLESLRHCEVACRFSASQVDRPLLKLTPLQEYQEEPIAAVPEENEQIIRLKKKRAELLHELNTVYESAEEARVGRRLATSSGDLHIDPNSDTELSMGTISLKPSLRSHSKV